MKLSMKHTRQFLLGQFAQFTRVELQFFLSDQSGSIKTLERFPLGTELQPFLLRVAGEQEVPEGLYIWGANLLLFSNFPLFSLEPFYSAVAKLSPSCAVIESAITGFGHGVAPLGCVRTPTVAGDTMALYNAGGVA